jgi:hypothetical protein
LKKPALSGLFYLDLDNKIAANNRPASSISAFSGRILNCTLPLSFGVDIDHEKSSGEF